MPTPSPTQDPAMDTPPSLPARPPPARGRPSVNLTADQKAALVDRVAEGKGVDLALRSVGGTYRGYRNACRDDPDFRAEVDSARRAADQTLDYVGHLAAFDVGTEGGREILFKLWDRRDRARNLNVARRDRSREREEDRRERRLDRALRLHEMELDAAVAMARATARALPDPALPPQEPTLDLSRLTEAELAMFRALVAKMLGEPFPAGSGTIDV